jgi:hypothetical protein
MATTNPITGDKIQTKPSHEYVNRFDLIDWSNKGDKSDPLCKSCGEVKCICKVKIDKNG